MIEKRNVSIDIIKAFTILLVIIGHSIQYGCGTEYLESNAFFQNFLFRYIYSFHMPLFAMISGYLFYYTISKRNFKKVIINRLQRLLIPIMSWQVILCIWTAVMNFVKFGELNFLSTILSYKDVIHNMWFLWSMLGLSLVTAFVHYVLKDKIWVYIIVFIISPFLPFIGKFIWLYPFFVGAYLFAKYREKLASLIKTAKKPYSIAVFIAIHFILVLLWKNDYYIYVPPGLGFTVYGQENYLDFTIALVYRTFAGAIGSIAVILTIDAIVKLANLQNINKIVSMLSRYSLGIYVFSVHILNEVVSWLIPGKGFNLLIVLIIALAQVVISLIVMFIIDKIKILRKLLLGGR